MHRPRQQIKLHYSQWQVCDSWHEEDLSVLTIHDWVIILQIYLPPKLS